MRRTLAVLLLATLPACRTATGPVTAVAELHGERDPSPELSQIRARVEGDATVIEARLHRKPHGMRPDNDLWTFLGYTVPFNETAYNWNPDNTGTRWQPATTLFRGATPVGTVTYYHDKRTVRLVARPAFTGVINLLVVGNGIEVYTVTVRAPAAGGHLAVE